MIEETLPVTEARTFPHQGIKTIPRDCQTTPGWLTRWLPIKRRWILRKMMITQRSLKLKSMESIMTVHQENTHSRLQKPPSKGLRREKIREKGRRDQKIAINLAET